MAKWILGGIEFLGNMEQRIETDFLVLGGGLAGQFAALRAARYGRVVLATKSDLQTSNSFQAQGGIAAAIAEEDSPGLHLEDTLQAGRGLCNTEVVEILVHEAILCIEDLLSLGVRFDPGERGPHLGQEAGHSRRRILHAGGSATGESVMRVLANRVREDSRIRVIERLVPRELLTVGSHCGGVSGYAQDTAQWLFFSAAATILATGGAAGLFSRTTNPSTTTGDGIALAYRAGAEVMDMEFIQFHPTALHSRNGRAFLLSEAVRGEGAYLLNAAGQRFMPQYDEMGELAPRDVVAAAIFQEMSQDGSDHVFLSLRHLDADLIRGRFPNLYQMCLEQGIDMTQDLVPVAPAAHYTIGGVRADPDSRTNLEGLWACGEVACTGLHGANRLASNSLLECLVFSKRAVESAAGSRLTPPPFRVPPEPSGPPQKGLISEGGPLPRLLTRHVGLVRNRQGLLQAQQEFETLRRQAEGNGQECPDRLCVASLMTESALLRTESRGVHRRDDFPREDPAWRKHTILKRGCEPRHQSEESITARNQN